MRPKTRGECLNGPRPCPWVSCKYHLGIEVGVHSVTKVTEHDGWMERDTCALDVADRGEHSYRAISPLMMCTHEGARKIANRGIDKILRYYEARHVARDDFGLDDMDDARSRMDWKTGHREHDEQTRHMYDDGRIKKALKEDRLSRLGEMIARRLFGAPAKPFGE